MALFDRIHRSKGWDGVGYHFVIDNGRGARDGLVEVGPRWKVQKHGAHTGKTPGNEYNELGIGICLVGNFMNTMPTPLQVRSMNMLIEQLMAEYRIPSSRVIAHRDAPRAKTSCCGDQLNRYLNRRYHLGRSTLAGR
jgi:N-acetylmuramoyl-L-alanine amidase